MRQATGEIEVATRGKGLYDCTDALAGWLTPKGIRSGLVTLFIRHTSASLTVQENADPDVVRDLNEFFSRLAPENDPRYRHTVEGPDDMPAHIRAALTLTQLSIPVISGQLALGTWQGVYVFEHRAAPHRRKIALHAIGE